MKKQIFILFFGLSLVFFSCNSEEETPKKEHNFLPLVEVLDGVYTEYYPDRKAVKITGNVDEKNLRNGKWVFYSESGLELSITHYSHGIKDGHSIVKYPNGAMHYYGEYKNDIKVGVWKSYDEKGKLISEDDFEGL